ncbi:putative plastid light harvesting protein isoform 58 [Aureococcus anophagefferens]|uniref:Putative plastid light harvesting protein isoform 58 n=1 Tax=Aureococcus anophagefferens TaxID=44056 RepID=F0YLU7_AURAN|nr:putative plastid light harvesting protein isoform 58 [Aureococcus anophagefferens]EGB03955.1 putative plastid light harvesting protein isoform 58 [Aureococcus anophagefferens]|eukprot:XP_009041378.1 putative plastid light harvesting protein isoform 58 [Aureococcus anophagefferens]
MAVLKLALLAAGASAFVAPTPKTSMMALKADAVVEAAAPEPAAPAAAPAAAMTFGKMLGDEQFDYSSIVGAEGGLGVPYAFDPMNFAGKYPGMVPWFREAELKHGRMCMLASIGMVVPAIVRVPGEQFQGTYTGWEAHDRLVASGSLGQILLFVGLAETLGGIPAVVATMKGERAPGDFEFGATFKPTDEKELKRKQLAELKNGRLAMLAFSGQVTQAVLTGHDAPFLW